MAGTPLSAWKAMVPTAQGRSPACRVLSSHYLGAERDQQVSLGRWRLGGRRHTHTYTWAHTHVRAAPPALPYLLQSGRYT